MAGMEGEERLAQNQERSTGATGEFLVTQNATPVKPFEQQRVRALPEDLKIPEDIPVQDQLILAESGMQAIYSKNQDLEARIQELNELLRQSRQKGADTKQRVSKEERLAQPVTVTVDDPPKIPPDFQPKPSPLFESVKNERLYGAVAGLLWRENQQFQQDMALLRERPETSRRARTEKDKQRRKEWQERDLEGYREYERERKANYRARKKQEAAAQKS
jgi:hypothetical protein